MKIIKFVMLVLFAVVLILFPELMVKRGYGLDICPEVVGNAEGDSVLICFETFDTTNLPVLADPDSLMIIRFGPDGSMVDSVGEDGVGINKVRNGSYEVRMRGADVSGNYGRYNVRVYAFIGDVIRGASSASYYVRDHNWEGLDTVFTYIRAVLDTLNDGFASQTNQSNLDASVSSRSTLTESNNIGINWADIQNATAMQYFTGTCFGTVLNPVQVDSAKIGRSVWDDDVVARDGRIIAYADSIGNVNGSATFEIPGSLWDTLTVIHEDISSGSGAYACSLYVYRESDTSAVQGAALRILNNSETATAAVGISDSEGLMVSSLDEAGYKVRVYRAGIQAVTIPVEIYVSAPSETDTVWVKSFDPGEPVPAELCRVYGWVYDLSGNALEGIIVSAQISENPVRYGSHIISPFYRTCETNSSGYWEMDVYPSEVLTPDDCKYEFMIYYNSGRIARRKVVVPDLASWELNW